MAATAPRASTPRPRSARTTARRAGSARSRKIRQWPRRFSDDGEAYYETDDSGDADAHLSPAGRGRAGEARSGEGARRSGEGPRRPGAATRRLPLTIEGELIAKSTGTVSAFTLGDRVFHQKFGNGNVTAIDGNKLTIQFDKAGEKRVVDSFVERA
jgi:DNA helicase-2/ATP-dependent DNA helicase PcrA